MIPREMLQKIRQVEIRTNRIVSGFAAGARVCDPQHPLLAHNQNGSDRILSGKVAAGSRPALRSFQPTAQTGRVPRMMPDRQNFDLPVYLVNGEIHGVRPWFRHSGLVCQVGIRAKPFRILGQGLQELEKRIVKSQTDTWLTILVPVDRLIPLQFGFALGDDLESHFGARRRCLISAEMSSIGVPRPGCFSASSARRFNSACCSCVNSSFKSPNSKPIISTNSRRSASGIRRSSLRMSALAAPTGSFRRAASRSSSSAKTCSAGIPEWGFFCNSSARRSNSASCSAVKSVSYGSSSSPNWSQRVSKMCCLSLGGSGRISSITSATVMSAIYSFESSLQAAFSVRMNRRSRANPPFVIRHSSFSPP